MSTDNEQLEILLILKYKTFNEMFDLWQRGNISLTLDEKRIMCKHLGNNFSPSAKVELVEDETVQYATIELNLSKD